MVTFLKSFSYKFCFFLGLGTATYVSYGQVQKWASHDTVKTIEHLVEKHVTRETLIEDQSFVPIEYSYQQPDGEDEAPAEMSTAPAPEAAPVPPSAENATEANPEEKKEEVAENPDASPAEVTGGVILPSQNPEITFVPQSSRSVASDSVPSIQSQPQVESQAMQAEIPLLPAALPVGPTFSASSSTASAPVSLPNALDARDLMALVSPLKASFKDKMIETSGLLCVMSGRDCERRHQVSVHSLRWGMEEGLRKNVNFSIKSLGAGNLEFNFAFTLESVNGSSEAVSLVARPVETLVHHETRQSKTYRIIEFRFHDLSVRGETIRNVHATLVYELTPMGLVLNEESELSFSRSKVDLLLSRWDESSQEESSSDGTLFLVADELVSSISIEKSL